VSTDVGLAAAREARAYRNLTQTYRGITGYEIYMSKTLTHTHEVEELCLSNLVSRRDIKP